jgi:hypothetical protein
MMLLLALFHAAAKIPAWEPCVKADLSYVQVRIRFCKICPSTLHRDPVHRRPQSTAKKAHLSVGKGAITPEQQPQSLLLVAFHHQLKEFLPALGTVDAAGS